MPLTNEALLKRRTILACMAGGLAVPSVAFGQSYPSKPVRVVVPYTAGASPDVVARFICDRLSRSLGQPFIIDNRPGAATIVGTQNAATAPADGYSLLYTVGSTLSINPYIYDKLAYKTEDFAPIVRVLTVPYVLVVSGNSPYKSVADLVKAAKDSPTPLTYATYGAGTVVHVAWVRLTSALGFKMTHIPYRDGGLPDIISQLVTASFEPSTTAIPMVQSGRLRALAVTTAARLPALPDVPSIGESYKGMEADTWQGFLAPRNTPPAVIARINEEVNKIVASQEFKTKTHEWGLQPVGGTPAEFGRHIAEDAKFWSKIVKDNNIRVD